MLVFGIVIATKPHQVRIKIEELDSFESDWYFVPQLCTVDDKSSNSIALHTLVGACVSDDLSDGCVIGALYNDEDVCIVEDEDIKLIKFEDGTLIQYDKTHSLLKLDCVGEIEIKASKIKIDGDVLVEGNVSSTKEINDRVGTMTGIRTVYNSHNHGNGNNGADTTQPKQQF